MRFGDPAYFKLLILLPVLIGFFIWCHQQRRAVLRRFASPSIITRLTSGKSEGRRWLKWILFLLSVFFLVLALARPRWGVKTELVERKGVDIIIALDISMSMLADDIVPNRLERAKHEIRRFIDLLKGDRIGLIVFAGESYVQCPLTLDYGAAAMFLDAVSTGWISVQGTNLGQAVDQASEAFRSKSRKHKVLLIITDGEDHEGNVFEKAKKAADEGVRIYTVGIGSEQGVPIPLQRGGGNVVYKKDGNGDLVMTRLNQTMLERIAKEGNGSYFHAGTDLDLDYIYREIMKMEEKAFGMNKVAVYEEQYQWFLGCALVLLLIQFFLPEQVRRKQMWQGRF